MYHSPLAALGLVAPGLVAAITLLSACGPAPAPGCCAPEPAPPAPSSPAGPIIPPPPPADPLTVGSPAARDDLYCGGLILAANPTPASAMGPIEEARLIKAQNLGVNLAESGIDRLIAEGLAHATHAAFISEAYKSRAGADLASGTPRITMDACAARAQALPPVQ